MCRAKESVGQCDAHTLEQFKRQTKQRYAPFALEGSRDVVPFVLGGLMLALLLPVVGVVVGTAVLWDALDRGFMGRPCDGLLFKFARWFNKATASFNSRFVKRPADAFSMNVIALVGVALPCLFAWNLYQTQVHGFSLLRCFVYHVLRIGPYFMNFAYVYTLCHKEGHSRLGYYQEPYNSVLRNVFNWWVSLFFGVFPSSFAYGHSVNHHKYNNGPLDVITTCDRPRDSFFAFVCYLPRFTMYALNVSTIHQFWSEGDKRTAFRMMWGTLYFGLWVGLVAHFAGWTFALAYIVYPSGENILLLAVVGWVWHAFLNPENPKDEFVGSITIFDGPINVLNEDFHVVHHQYPGTHWEANPELFTKHLDRGEYANTIATCFRNTHVFELFFLIILRDYNMMVDKFVFMSSNKLDPEQVRELLMARLRYCWWGPRSSRPHMALVEAQQLDAKKAN